MRAAHVTPAGYQAADPDQDHPPVTGQRHDNQAHQTGEGRRDHGGVQHLPRRYASGYQSSGSTGGGLLAATAGVSAANTIGIVIGEVGCNLHRQGEQDQQDHD